MLNILFEDSLKSCKVCLCHSFDDKVFVLTEEKEAATLSLGFTSLEN
jgi:hypothetical protein